MKKCLQRKINFGVAILLSVFASIWVSLKPALGVGAGPDVSDRLVVSVSGSSYTQRHVAGWFLVRELLQEPSAQKEKLPRASFMDEVSSSWKDVLQKFSEDMVIRQEAARLGSFQPSPKAIMKAGERVSARRATDAQLASGIAALAVGDEEISRFIATILQVEGFRKSRERPMSAPARDAINPSSTWLSELKSRAVVRVYEGGDTWVPLNFKGQKP